MSHSDIYNQIRRNSHNAINLPEHPAYPAVKLPMDYDKDLLQRKLKTKKDFRDFKESFEILNDKPFDIITVADNTGYSDQAIVNNKENTRKAKKLWNHDLNVSINNTVNLSEIDSTIQNIDETSAANEENSIENVVKATATPKVYEVTEDNDKSPATGDLGYQYNPPTDETQNLTSTFHKILSKYNINSEDRLQNYDLSLQRKVPNPSTSAYRVPLPFGYNNLNHLPVDPLLAVFLSNYGFYLPSLYGIKANYNNLYGYLASNNIHNNRPFGLYKVFSDTDSWN